MNKLKLVIIGFAMLLLSSCSSVSGNKNKVGDSGAVDPYTGVMSSTYFDEAYGKRGTFDRIIYFDYDSDRLRQESYAVVQAHADELKQDLKRGMWLEGHTDDRGSHEYNMGLGERRANAVKDLMISYGVNANQLKVRSYGKELPAVGGYDENAWAQNRRVELVY